MGRTLLAALALALLTTAAQAQPTEDDIAKYRARLAEYVAKTEDTTVICSGLVGWYGWPFYAVRDHSAGTIDFYVRAPVHGAEVRYLRLIGSVKMTEPRVLMEPPQ